MKKALLLTIILLGINLAFAAEPGGGEGPIQRCTSADCSPACGADYACAGVYPDCECRQVNPTPVTKGDTGTNECQCTGSCQGDKCYVVEVTYNGCIAGYSAKCIEDYTNAYIICAGGGVSCQNQGPVTGCECKSPCGLEGYPCCSEDACNSGLYCSSGYCCWPGDYWDGDRCTEGADECTEQGYNVFNTLPWYSSSYGACCSNIFMYGRYGNYFIPITVY